MFNPLLAPVDGYYPIEREGSGGFQWMTDQETGVIHPGHFSAYDASEFISAEGKKLGPMVPRFPAFPFGGGQSALGECLFLDNGFDAIGDTAEAVNYINVKQVRFAGFIDDYTWAAVLTHSVFPSSTFIRDIFAIQNVFIGSIFHLRVQELVGFLRVTLVGATPLDVPINADNSANDQQGIRWVITYSHSDDTLRVYQDGVETGSQIFPMSTIPTAGNVNFITGGFNKTLDSFSGWIGSQIFQTRAWTPEQVAAWSSDPFGHYRPRGRRFVAQPDPCEWFDGPPTQEWSADASDSGFIAAQGQQDWASEQRQQDWAAPDTGEWFDDKECD